jgi:ketosteroid isomerase-like protein
MLTMTRPTFLLLLFSATMLAASADEQAVRAALAQFNDAARKGDAATLEKLLGADLIYGHSSALIENKAECIAALVKGKPNFEMAPEVQVKLYGKTAIVHGKMTAHVVQNGTPNKIPLDLLQVWVKSGKTWQMVARHTTRLPA